MGKTGDIVTGFSLDLLARLDAAIAELTAIRAELAVLTSGKNSENAVEPDNCPDDLSPEHLLDTTSAAERFGHPRDTIALWCRQGAGRKVGGRWMVSIPALQRRLNGKG